MASDGTPTTPMWSGGKLMRVSGRLGPHFDLMARNDFLYNYVDDKFIGDLLRDYYPAAKTNGTSAAVTFTEHNAQGFLELVTGTDLDGYAGQGVGLQWTGDRGVLAEFLIETPSSLADFKFEVGLSDADDDAGAVNSKTTPTVTATDCAVLVYDSSHSSSLDLIHVKGGGTATRVTNTAVTIAVSTVYHVAFRIVGDDIQVMIRGLSGTPLAEAYYANAVGAAGIEGGSKLTPWVFAQARAGTANKTLKWHKWAVTWPAW